MKRILYLQYTNPGCYPPLLRGARILSGRGWSVLFAGADVAGVEALRFPDMPNVRVKKLRLWTGRALRKARYAAYAVWAAALALRWRPDWIYASDPVSCAAALTASAISGSKRVYHEHDTPARMPAWTRNARRAYARDALCVLPNETRAKRFEAECGRRPLLVRNLPSVSEIAEQDARPGRFVLYYFGSIVPQRLPVAVVKALTHLPEEVALKIVGYEPDGAVGYVRTLLGAAAEAGVAARVAYAGVKPPDDLGREAADTGAGLCLLPVEDADFNESTMIGASNKAYQFMAWGLPVVVVDSPSWKAEFVEAGYGVACNPADARDIAAAVRRLLELPDRGRAMGRAGREKIAREWNYEKEFAAVVDALERGVSRE